MKRFRNIALAVACGALTGCDEDVKAKGEVVPIDDSFEGRVLVIETLDSGAQADGPMEDLGLDAGDYDTDIGWHVREVRRFHAAQRSFAVSISNLDGGSWVRVWFADEDTEIAEWLDAQDTERVRFYRNEEQPDAVRDAAPDEDDPIAVGRVDIACDASCSGNCETNPGRLTLIPLP